MSKHAKTSLKLPIFLMIGPALGLVLSIILYAIINFVITSSTVSTPDTVNPSLSDGASVAQGSGSDTELYGDSSIFRTVSNVVLFLLGSVSVLAFLPCLVVGIIILNKRRNIQTHGEPIAKNKESRDWGDLE